MEAPSRTLALLLLSGVFAGRADAAEPVDGDQLGLDHGDAALGHRAEAATVSFGRYE